MLLDKNLPLSEREASKLNCIDYTLQSDFTSYLPHSTEAEQAVLGGLLIDNSALKEVRTKLDFDHFYHANHQIIFSCILEEAAKKGNFDFLTIVEKLKTTGKLEEVGGEAYIFSLAKNTPTAANISIYADIIIEKTQRRMFLKLGDELKLKSANTDLADLTALIEASRYSIEESLHNEKGLRSVSLQEFLSIEHPKREFILSPWLPQQGLAMIYAKRGVGKTFVALNIAYAVASGGSFLNWRAEKPRGVLYLDGEMPALAMQERLKAISHSHKKELSDPTFLELITPDLQSSGMPDLASFEGQRLIEHKLDNKELIVVDNISTLCRNGHENDADSWLPIQEWALKMRSQGRSVLFIHHAGKSGNQRGTSNRETILDTVISLKHHSNYSPDQGAVFEIHFEKARGFYGYEAKPFLAQLKTEQDQHVWLTSPLEESTYENVVKLAKQGFTQTEITAKSKINKSGVSRYIKRAKEEGKL